MDSFALMRVNNFKNIIAYLLLGIFISVKVAGFHVFNHSDNKADEIEHCETCDFITINNLTPLTNANLQNVEFNILELFTYSTKNPYFFIYCSTLTNDCLFSRPPPTLT